MTDLAPLETLYEAAPGDDLRLPPTLAKVYGRFRLPRRGDSPYVAGNFVATLDGVVTLGVPGHAGGGDISGFNQHDRAVMSLLRAVADAVVVGAGTLRALPKHLWTPEYSYPPLADEYRELRGRLGKSGPPLNVIVSGSGNISLDLPVFRTPEIPALIVTTASGAKRLQAQSLPTNVMVRIGSEDPPVSAAAVLDAIHSICSADMILVEGGPHLLADFLAEQRLDELFLTLAPQIAGRDGSAERPGLVAGRIFAPERPLWGTLVSIKRGGSHLFLRYSFNTAL